MNQRAIVILNLASSHPPARWLSVEDIVQMIRPSCPGLRTANAWARELIWELTQEELLERAPKRDRYRITISGRRMIETHQQFAEVAQ